MKIVLVLTVIVVFCGHVAEGAFGCPEGGQMTDYLRQQVLDFHNNFRTNVGRNEPINYKNNNFTFESGQNMYKVKYNCELEQYSAGPTSQCTWEANNESKAAGAVVIGNYFPQYDDTTPSHTFYNAMRQWLWEYYNKRTSNETLTKGNGMEGATLLHKYNIEVGCSFRNSCWINENGQPVKKRVAVCSYWRRGTNATNVYEKGVACKTDEDCTTYPAKCEPQWGLCVLKSQPPAYGRLSYRGLNLTGENNQSVALHGMCLFGTNNGDGIPFYVPSAIQQLKCNWNTNAFRAVLDTGNGADGGYIMTERDFPNKKHDKYRLDTVIKAAIEFGMYVIVDWHGIAGQIALYKPQATAYFSYVSERFGMFPHMLYETFNEPYNSTWTPFLKNYHLTMINAIRAFDKKNVIIVSPPMGDYPRNDTPIESPITGHVNIAYTKHFYAASHKLNSQYNPQKYLDAGLPLFVTEYGTTDHTGRTGYDAVEMQKWWDYLDANKISYFNWALENAGEQRHMCSALVNKTAVSDMSLDSKLTTSGRLVKTHYKNQNNGVSC
ncbi:Cellulase [Aphelenchoides besseyi]|nr:Cellulase [Aphelenchoides besseyi]